MPKEKGMHLNFDDRCIIEELLKERASFRSIAKLLNVSPTTISNEVKLNRTFFKPVNFIGQGQSRCSNYSECRIVNLCSSCLSKASACKRCKRKHCFDFCKKFSLVSCPKLNEAPFVCARCSKRKYCCYSQARYIASKAQRVHDNRIRQAHVGVCCSERELEQMVNLVKKLLSQGQSLEAIWAVHGNEFPVCARTFYNYIEKGVMNLKNIELPKKVKYAPRKKRSDKDPKMDLAGRTYSDWLELPDEQKVLTVQIDTVEGTKKNSKCILSLHFTRLFFQIYILLEAKTQMNVKLALDALESYCGESFSYCFPVLLGDRGCEFLDYLKIEESSSGGSRTKMFYCDPLKPGQKGAAEKNHVELRKILPKKTDFDKLTAWDVALVCSHVNSYVRAGHGAAPIDAAAAILPQNLLESLGITKVDPDNVIMTPSLLKL